MREKSNEYGDIIPYRLKKRSDGIPSPLFKIPAFG